MDNFAPDKKYYTKEEYFLLEETALEKYEFENGEVFAMPGGSFNHGLICNNINRKLSEALNEKDCVAIGSDLRLEIAAAHSFVYPDAMVICGKAEFAGGRNDLVKNPVLVVKVLSGSTESYDWGKKFKKYQSLPSFREYVLISQTEPVVETFLRQDENRWLYTLTEGLDAEVVFASINSRMVLMDIYWKVDFAEA